MSRPQHPPRRPTLSACVINHNGGHQLDRCLDRLLQEEERLSSIVLVDDASTNDDVQRVRRTAPSVEVLALPVNAGPARARNTGFERLTTDLILFLDCDAFLTVDCLAHLERALASRPGAVAAMPRVVFAHDPGRVQFEGASAHPLGLMALHGGLDRAAGAAAAEPLREPHEIGSLVTTCFLLDRTRWGEAPPFDDDFFSQYEDHDFALRARIAGHTLLAAPAAVCLHGTGTPGLSVRDQERSSRRRVYLLIRNRWQILAKCYQLRTLIALAPLLLLYEAAQAAGAVRNGWVREWLRASAWVLRHMPRLLRKRRRVQRSRRQSDRDLLTSSPLPIRAVVTRGAWVRRLLAMLDSTSAAYWRIARRTL